MSLPAQSQIPFHRCRFAKWKPYGITAISFNQTGSKLALSRESGDIEIWNAIPVFYCEKRIPGYGEASIQTLLWLPPLSSSDDYDSDNETSGEKSTTEAKERLISVGINGRIIEWNLQLLTPSFAVDSFGGAIWAAATDPNKQTLCAGCEDGTLRLFDLSSTMITSPILYLKSLARHLGRVLTVCWKYDILISGGVDGVIKFWNPETGMNTGRITLESLGGIENYVWSLDMIGENTVISGDSYGKVQLWDRKFGTLITTFNQHKADVLCVRASPSDDVFYASGVDNLVCEYRLVTESNDDEENVNEAENKENSSILGYKKFFNYSTPKAHWVYTSSQRPHTHDIRALAISPVITRNYRLIVSGGVDTELCIYNSLQFKQRPLKMFSYPLYSPISLTLLSPPSSLLSSSPSLSSSSATSRYLHVLSCHESTLDLFRINLSAPSSSSVYSSSSSQLAQLAYQPNPPVHLASINTSPTLNLIRSSSAPSAPNSSILTKPIKKKEKKSKKSDSKKKSKTKPEIGLQESKSSKSQETEQEVLAIQPHLLCSTLSPDSTLVACSDVTTVKLFQLRFEEGTEKPSIQIEKIDISNYIEPASALIFSVDSQLLIAATLSGLIQVLRINKNDKKEKVSKIKEWKQAQKGQRHLTSSINQMSISDDGQYLATVNMNTNIPITIYNLKSLQYETSLPVISSPIAAISFYPSIALSNTNFPLLALWCMPNQLFFYHLKEKRFIDHPLSSSALSSSNPWWTPSRDRVVRLSFFVPNNNKNLIGLVVQAINYIGIIKFSLSALTSSSSPSLSPVSSSKKTTKSPVISPKQEKTSEIKSKKRKNSDDAKSGRSSSLIKKDKTRSRPYTWQDHEITNQYGSAYITFIEKFRPMLLAQALTWEENHTNITPQPPLQQQEKKQKISPTKSPKLSPISSPLLLSKKNSTNNTNTTQLSTHMIVVEVPWLMLIQNLPNPLYRHRYGT